MSFVYLVFCVLFTDFILTSEAKTIQRLRPHFENEDMIPIWIKLRLNETRGSHGFSTDPERTWGTIWNWITGLGSGGGAGAGGGTGGGGGDITGISGGTGGGGGGTTGGSGGVVPIGITGVSIEEPEPDDSGEDPALETCDCECGTINSKKRIVGGQETQVNQYPWMAMLLYDGRFYCGATLINQDYVLTAAHCVEGFTSRRIKVRLLEHDRNDGTESKPINRNVKVAIIHNKYNQNTFNNDIALLRLDSPVKLVADLRPACLPEKGKRYTGEEAIVTGWGKVAENKPVSPVLREVKVPVLSNAKCGSFYGTSQITDNMLCAGYKEGGRDSCQGDSGGPLHMRNGSIHHIIGVVSWGEGCARPNNPGVYARVNRYLTWISSNTKGTCFCKPNRRHKSTH